MGRNLVKFKKILMTSSPTRKYDVIIRHFDVATTWEEESLHCFFVFEWINLKFVVRGNFRLLISNLNSKTQYQFEILRKFHLSSLRS